MESTTGAEPAPRDVAAGATPARGPALLALLGAALLLVAAAIGPWQGATGVVLAAILPVAVAVPHGRRVTTTVALITPVAAGLGVVVNSRPVAVSTLMAIATVGVALAAYRGLRGPAVYLALEAGLAGVGAPPSLPNETAALPLKALVCAAVALGTALVVAALHRLLLRGLRPVRRAHLTRRQATQYGVLLGVLLVPTTWLVATYWPGSRAGWLLLTILVAVRPTSADTRRVVADRLLGTLAGGVAAALFALLLPAGELRLAVGAICAIVAVATRILRIRYAVFVSALTPAVVLLGSHPDATWSTDAARVGYTLAASAAVIALSTAGRALLSTLDSRVLKRSSTGESGAR